MISYPSVLPLMKNLFYNIKNKIQKSKEEEKSADAISGEQINEDSNLEVSEVEKVNENKLPVIISENDLVKNINSETNELEIEVEATNENEVEIKEEQVKSTLDFEITVAQPEEEFEEETIDNLLN